MSSKATVAVSRIVSNSPKFALNKFKPKHFKPNNNNNNNIFNKKQDIDKPDAYDICIKAKAIARSSGASSALSFDLNKLPSTSASASTALIQKSSRPVLINTILTALSREGQTEKFWHVFESKVLHEQSNWSPQLSATVLNQIAKEMQAVDDKNDNSSSELIKKAGIVYIKSLEILNVPEHLHIHNSYLKCISRSKNVPYLMWILKQISRDLFSDIDLKLFGIQEYLPVDEISLKLAKTITESLKKAVELDCQSLTLILNTLARSSDGSIQLAEVIWSKFNHLTIDKPCHLVLLLVYRNDLSRIFNQRKLIRATSWREKKHARVLEIIKNLIKGEEANFFSSTDHKLISIYFEICLNAKLKEKIVEFLGRNPVVTEDQRLLELIRKAQRGNRLLE